MGALAAPFIAPILLKKQETMVSDIVKEYDVSSQYISELPRFTYVINGKDIKAVMGRISAPGIKISKELSDTL